MAQCRKIGSAERLYINQDRILIADRNNTPRNL